MSCACVRGLYHSQSNFCLVFSIVELPSSGPSRSFGLVIHRTNRSIPSTLSLYIDRDLFLLFGTGGEASLDAEAGACVLAVERGRQDGETDKEPSMIFRSVGL